LKNDTNERTLGIVNCMPFANTLWVECVNVVSKSIKYGLGTSIEGLVGVYDGAVEGNEQMTFFSIFRNYFLYFD
jgi:hypothetical protein